MHFISIFNFFIGSMLAKMAKNFNFNFEKYIMYFNLLTAHVTATGRIPPEAGQPPGLRKRLLLMVINYLLITSPSIFSPSAF